jgi:hypothetical protein
MQDVRNRVTEVKRETLAIEGGACAEMWRG